DEETMRFLNDVIVLCVQANPDGQELVANWYMREKDPLKRSMNGLPRLYAKYVGHDDNRDFYMSNMKETTNMNRQMFIEWFPQMIYNHHQTGPAGAVIFMPPFRDPFNYNFDPLVPLGIEMVGTAMHSRLVAEGKGGSAMRTGARTGGRRRCGSRRRYPRWRRRRRPRGASFARRVLQYDPARSANARSSRLHRAIRSGRFCQCHRVHQRADQERDRDPSRQQR